MLSIEDKISKNSDRTKYLIDCILQFVALNKNNFITDENDFYQPKTPFGKINKGSSETVITILKSKADEVFKENNISDSRNLLNILKEKKMLDSEKDRPSKRCRITRDLEEQPCYIFKIKYNFFN